MSVIATFRHVPGRTDATLEFLKRIRSELRAVRRVQVWTDRLEIFDVNQDSFVVENLGYPDPEIIPVLHEVHAVFDPQKIHEPAGAEFKEFATGKRRPWAEDRVM